MPPETGDTINELKRKRAEQVDAANALLDSIEERADKSMTEEDETNYQAYMAEAKRMGAMIAKREEVEREAGAYVPKDGEGPVEQRGESRKEDTPSHHQRRTPDTENGIYCRWLRSGDPGAANELRAINSGLDLNEYRASNDTTMNIGTAADGGDLVPTGHFQGIIARLRPMALWNLMGVREIPGRGTTVDVPVDNEADSGEFVSTNESAAFDRDAPAISKVQMTLVKYTKKVDLTYELLEDEDSRLMEFLDNYIGSGMAATMNKLMVDEALADGTAALTLDSATAIGASEIPELFYKMKAEYARGNVRWLMQFATEGEIRALQGDNFLFRDTPAGSVLPGSNGNLWNKPAFTDENMGAIGSGNKSLLIGDFNYMGMRMAPGMTVLRDPYSRAGNGELILHYFFRTVFEVLQAEAFQYATHATA